MSKILTDVPSSVVAFYAHPDDADVSCGATLAFWSQMGSAVVLVVCTKGEKGTIDKALEPDELEQIRIAEVDRACDALGIAKVIRLAIPDGEVANTGDFRTRLVGIIREFKPEAVLCPDPTAVFFGSGYFNHRDHRELGWAVLDSVSPAASLPHYFPSAGPPHQVMRVLLSGSLDADAFVDVSSSIDKKLEAVLCHKTQIQERGEWMRDAMSTRAKDTGRIIGAKYAEAFRLLELGS